MSHQLDGMVDCSELLLLIFMERYDNASVVEMGNAGPGQLFIVCNTGRSMLALPRA